MCCKTETHQLVSCHILVIRVTPMLRTFPKHDLKQQVKCVDKMFACVNHISSCFDSIETSGLTKGTVCHKGNRFGDLIQEKPK